AVMSSDSFDDDSETKKPTVQVGDPFVEKLLMEACMDLFKTDHIVGIQDMGAAGLTSSAFEMAGRSGSGMIMHLDKVPAREEGMVPYEFMLSESQERMLICAKKGREEQIIEIFKKYELEAEVIGEVTDTGNMELFWHGEKVCDMPINPVSEEAPVLDRPTKEPKYLKEIKDYSIEDADLPSSTEILKTLIGHPEVADKRWIYEQYDSTIQTNSLTKLGKTNSGVMRVKGTDSALAISVDCNPRFCYVDPKNGSAAAVAESGRNVAMSGATPLSITDCLNFGNPENPEVMWQFKEACEGIKEACKELNTPVVSGNVSLYNETNGVSVFPTPSIGMVGLLEDASKTLTPEFKKAGNSVYVVGDTTTEFGGSLILKVFGKKVGGVLPELDFSKEKALWNLVKEANEDSLLESAHDISVGGVAVALSKMAIGGNLGFEGMASVTEEYSLFNESFSRAIFEVKPENSSSFEELLTKAGLSFECVGKVTENNFILNSISVDTNTLSEIYYNSFTHLMEKDL
ncbi:MAG: phosphoribosylformylglycinamidine synthase subunit PurL, partial [Campylobacterales bacterium]|nr:phosphoribosylformylglycinamidine synthase subunit PurL [Campylobacterales bacterium]